jgi:glycerophosphoryl diester phosphodiesterase
LQRAASWSSYTTIPFDRTTNGRGAVSEKSLEELRAFDAGKGQTIPTLAEVLELCHKRVRMNIELKGKGTAEPVARFIKDAVDRDAWQMTDFWVSSFDYNELRRFRQSAPLIEIGLLSMNDSIDYVFAEEVRATSVGISQRYATRAVIQTIHAREMKCFVFTVNRRWRIKRLAWLGADGIFSNYPDRLHR